MSGDAFLSDIAKQKTAMLSFHSPTTLPAGASFGVGGAYIVRRRLGAGGMGVVYLARQTSLGRDVAIKVLDDPAASPAARERFLAEPKLMVKFPDAAASNIVPVLDCGTDPASGLPYYVMEAELLAPETVRAVCEGFGNVAPPPAGDGEPQPLSLADLLRDGHILPDEALARLALDIVPALATLHGAGIVHRDLKPSNLLFSATGRLLLADFGIAKDIADPADDLTRRSLSSNQPGSRHYAAPEQRDGFDAVPATDYYALGVLLFRALTGGYPPAAFRDLPEDCDTRCRGSWRRLIAALLERDPTRRLHDPARIAAALRRIVRAAGWRRRLVEWWVRRRTRIAALLGMVVAIAATLVGIRAARSPEHHPVGTLRTVELPGGTTLELAWVPAGRFTVEGVGRTHEVGVTRGFWMATGETTCAQWAAVMGTPPPTPEEAETPVSRVSWIDCTNFIARANAAVSGLTLALPTEAEWELAARGGAEPGPDEAALAWHAGNSGKKRHPGRELSPNAYGLYDMGGNVAEWCRDWNGPERFVGGGLHKDPAGPDAGSERICRGGSYLSAPANVGPTARGAAFPDVRMPHIGFRVAGR